MEKYVVFAVDFKNTIQVYVEVPADEAEVAENIILQSRIDDQEIVASDYNYLPAF